MPPSLNQTETPSIIWRDTAQPKDYEKARTCRLFNGKLPERYPTAIMFAKTEHDVVDATKLATERRLRVSIRAGGHSYAAWSVRDDALLLDLGELSELTLDKTTGIVSLSPSITGRDLDQYLVANGRAFPGGHCPDVAMGGYLLGGGMGWNTNNWGWACESVVAIDAVTAEGQLVRADANENAELLWAARGGGPAFPGIVTRFHIQTRSAPKVMRSSVYVFPMTHYKTALSWALEIASSLENTIELTAVGSYQEGIQSPCIMVILLAMGDDKDFVEELLRSVEDSRPDGALSASVCKETSIQQEYDNKAKAFPVGPRYKVDNVFLRNDADVVSLLESPFNTLPTRQSMVLWTSMKPRSSRPLTNMALMGRHSIGSYLGEYDFQTRASDCWGAEQHQRLVELRHKWDPDNRICGCLGLDDI
ncbi:hypothetical protein KVR01_004554 [Diaporthe batatas]|uniref:uncharacterized protein n=1 Tax=Diaporthe batatas TaxID=748121 RepID=UPI001D04AE8D|nr:uncharacterized protein KVR01_004554 [Diaporthe batatas]KAG8166002.1 hypothetical protein KVR01_004554 [Diaporthe batatas]